MEASSSVNSFCELVSPDMVGISSDMFSSPSLSREHMQGGKMVESWSIFWVDH